uniref:SH2 domain-containing protein n=1 Tax=Parascaris equorum TaxID=6256 RepID=A0A914R6C7_PAREQ
MLRAKLNDDKMNTAMRNQELQVGDFIVRTTQPRPSDPREIVISVRVSVDESDPMAVC